MNKKFFISFLTISLIHGAKQPQPKLASTQTAISIQQAEAIGEKNIQAIKTAIPNSTEPNTQILIHEALIKAASTSPAVRQALADIDQKGLLKNTASQTVIKEKIAKKRKETKQAMAITQQHLQTLRSSIEQNQKKAASKKKKSNVKK